MAWRPPRKANMTARKAVTMSPPVAHWSASGCCGPPVALTKRHARLFCWSSLTNLDPNHSPNPSKMNMMGETTASRAARV